MTEVVEEIGTCDKCGTQINLAEAWRVDEKYYCETCFEELSL